MNQDFFAKSLKIVQGHWKWHYSIDRIRVPVCFTVQICLSCTVTYIFSVEQGVTSKCGFVQGH